MVRQSQQMLWMREQVLPELPGCMQTGQDTDWQVLAAWEKEQHELGRVIHQGSANTQLGNIFRTPHKPTYCSGHLGGFSDLYMAALSGLFTPYPRHTPYSRRLCSEWTSSA